MKAWRFRLVPDRTLKRLESATAPVLENWSVRWLGAEDGLTLRAVHRGEGWRECAGDEIWLWDGGDESCAMKLSAGLRGRWVASLLCSESVAVPVDTPMASALWLKAGRDLIAGVLDSLLGRTVKPQAVLRLEQELPTQWPARSH